MLSLAVAMPFWPFIVPPRPLNATEATDVRWSLSLGGVWWQDKAPEPGYRLRGVGQFRLVNQLPMLVSGADRGIRATVNHEVAVGDLPPLRGHAQVAVRIAAIECRADQITVAAR